MDFHRDVVADRMVVVNFVYTHCSGVCPMQGARFHALQDALGPRLDKDVRLVSVSLDPEHDTPEALRAWSEHHGAKPGWILLTGSRSSLEKLVTELVGAPIVPEAHSPFMVVGAAGRPWKRMFGLASPKQVLEQMGLSSERPPVALKGP